MEELLFHISLLPDLDLSDEEWKDFAAIFLSLKEKNAQAFLYEILNINNKHHINLFPNVSDKEITDYVNQWIIVSSFIDQLNNDIAYFWKLKTKNLINADDLLDVTYLLLPSKIDSTSCLKKIDLASQLSTRHIEYAFASLYTVISVKYSTDEKIIQEKKLSEKTQSVVSELNKYYTLQQNIMLNNMRILSKKYQSELENSMATIIKDRDIIAFNYYFAKKPKKMAANIINDIIEAIRFGSNLLNCLEYIVPLLNKFIMIQSFRTALDKKNEKFNAIYIEFFTKYSAYKSDVEKAIQVENDDDFFAPVGRFFSGLFSKKTDEFYFFTYAENFLLWLQKKTPHEESSLEQIIDAHPTPSHSL